MGRAANALDWTDEGSGVGLRALIAYPPPRTDSELPLQDGESARSAARSTAEDALQADEEGPTGRFQRESAIQPREATEPLSARGIARLSALADWMEAEEPSGAVVTLVRSFLHHVSDVGRAVGALVSAGQGPVGPELQGAIQSLALSIGMWRSNLVEHVDDLALSDHRSFSGWSSLPEYSSAFTLAIVRPALAEAEEWTTAATLRGGADLGPLVRAVGTRVEALNATLRAAVLGEGDGGGPHQESPFDEVGPTTW